MYYCTEAEVTGGTYSHRHTGAALGFITDMMADGCIRGAGSLCTRTVL